MTDQTTKRCIGPCGRTLPRTVDHFYRQSGGDGFAPRCRDCKRAAQRERRAARRERQAAKRADSPIKTCTGPCRRTLPRDGEHFHAAATSGDGLRGNCRDCANAAAREREAAEREREAAERESPEDARAAAAKGKLDELIAELAELGGGSASPIPFSSREGRLSFIRRRIEIAPPGQAAEAADRARRVMAAADRDVRELTRPPFDVREVFMDMAAVAGDEGVPVLATALRGQGWAP